MARRRRVREPLESLDLDLGVSLLLVSDEMGLVKDLDRERATRSQMNAAKDNAVATAAELFAKLEVLRHRRAFERCSRCR